MKFKETSWEELEKDFKKVLSQYTTEELIESLEKYKVQDIKWICLIIKEKNFIKKWMRYLTKCK